MKSLAVVFAVLLALSACSSGQNIPRTTLEKNAGSKIVLDVKTITLADRSNSQGPNTLYAANRFTPTIAEAIKQWAVDRLQANGQTGQAIIIVKNASLTAQPLPVKDGIDSWFTRQQATKYIGRAEVTIEANGRSGFAVAEANATRGLTLPEDPTPAEKQDAYNEMLNGLMKDLNANLESAIYTHMASFITTPPVFGSTAVPTGNAAASPTVDSTSLPEQTPQAAPASDGPRSLIPLSGSVTK